MKRFKYTIIFLVLFASISVHAQKDSIIGKSFSVIIQGAHDDFENGFCNHFDSCVLFFDKNKVEIKVFDITDCHPEVLKKEYNKVELKYPVESFRWKLKDKSIQIKKFDYLRLLKYKEGYITAKKFNKTLKLLKE